ncbi:MAG: D-alanyl-D-alanine carboxypeptidase [Desulfobulbaceae bacterium]|nr:D-alanyl-D-alanine carboxypeptidase [Desulfobulbaceae bacterium]
MKYLIGLLLCLLFNGPAQAQSDPFPQVADAYLVEVNGSALWSKQSNQRLPPASLTKLMTALLVVEQDKPDDVVRILPSATHETGSRIGLKANERFRLHDLLAATLIASANDACHALADHLAGNEIEFVTRMNRRAQELDLHDSHFSNACGHDAAGHYASANDISRLAHTLLKHPSLLDITSQEKLEITTLDGRRHYTLKNKNALIGRYEGAIGLKTGFTPNAGRCLVAYAQRGGNNVLLVMMHGKDRWWDAVDMLDLAFDHVRNTP